MEFLKLIESLAANINCDNIKDAVALIEKLIVLADSLDKRSP